MSTEIKPGKKTTEFYATLISSSGTLISALMDAIPDQVAAYIVAGLVGVYTISRSFVKVLAPSKLAGE